MKGQGFLQFYRSIPPTYIKCYLLLKFHIHIRGWIYVTGLTQSVSLEAKQFEYCVLSADRASGSWKVARWQESFVTAMISQCVSLPNLYTLQDRHSSMKWILPWTKSFPIHVSNCHYYQYYTKTQKPKPQQNPKPIICKYASNYASHGGSSVISARDWLQRAPDCSFQRRQWLRSFRKDFFTDRIRQALQVINGLYPILCAKRMYMTFDLLNCSTRTEPERSIDLLPNSFCPYFSRCCMRERQRHRIVPRI